MADDQVSVSLDVMIIEAGILANSVTPTDAGKALQAKIEAAADAAWAEQKPDVVISFTPFEAGMLLGGLSRSGGNVTGDLINRTFSAVNAKMEELGIQALNTPQLTLDPGTQGPAAGLDPSQLGQDGGQATDSSASTASGTDSTASAPATDSSASTPSDSSPSTSSSSDATESSASGGGQDGGAL